MRPKLGGLASAKKAGEGAASQQKASAASCPLAPAVDSGLGGAGEVAKARCQTSAGAADAGSAAAASEIRLAAESQGVGPWNSSDVSSCDGAAATSVGGSGLAEDEPAATAAQGQSALQDSSSSLVPPARSQDSAAHGSAGSGAAAGPSAACSVDGADTAERAAVSSAAAAGSSTTAAATAAPSTGKHAETTTSPVSPHKSPVKSLIAPLKRDLLTDALHSAGGGVYGRHTRSSSEKLCPAARIPQGISSKSTKCSTRQARLQRYLSADPCCSCTATERRAAATTQRCRPRQQRGKGGKRPGWVCGWGGARGRRGRA